MSTTSDMIRAAIRRLPKPEHVDKEARPDLAAAIDMLETCATDAAHDHDPIADAAELAAMIETAVGGDQDGMIRIPFGEAVQWQARLEEAVALNEALKRGAA